jgi:hypothetical protein
MASKSVPVPVPVPVPQSTSHPTLPAASLNNQLKRDRNFRTTNKRSDLNFVIRLLEMVGLFIAIS